MDNYIWAPMAIIIALVIIILAVIYIKKQRKNPTPTDYRALFNLGLIFFVIGIPLENYPMSGLGLVFLLAGIANKNKWKEQAAPTQAQRKFMIVALIVGVVALLAGTVIYYFKIN